MHQKKRSAGPENMQKIQRVREAMQRVHKLYESDPDLVREGAKHHGVEVVVGNMIDPIAKKAYNARIPEGTEEEIAAVQQQDAVIGVQCMDWRQSKDLADMIHPNASISTAGGAAQPDDERRQALVDLLVAIHEFNPTAKFELFAHTGVCGGMNHFTHGEAKKVHDEQGPEIEFDLMAESVQQMRDAMLEADVAPSAIAQPRIVVIGADNTIADIVSV